MRSFLIRNGEWTKHVGRAVAVVVVVFGAGGAAAWFASGTARPAGAGAPGAPGDGKGEAGGAKAAAPGAAGAAEKISRAGAEWVVVPPPVQASLLLKTAPVTVPTRKRKLPAFQGKLNFENSLFARVQSTFPGQVVELAQVPEPLLSAAPNGAEGKVMRTIKDGDKVTKGEVLAVVWSADLGSKKSAFLDALSKLKTDEKTYQNYASDKLGTFPERSLREAERTVQSDRVAVNAAEAALLTYRIGADEIQALRDEAERLTTEGKRTDPAKWARVEIKAPISGTVLEKNVSANQVVDTTSDLFRIGDLTTLAVWVHVYEEDLPLLRGVSFPAPWAVTAAALPGVTFDGRAERVNASIDPNQNTALVYGTVRNPKGDLRAGMGVSVTIELPPPTGELEVPAEAVCEDGRESVVYVRPDPAADTFVRTPVAVVRRSRDVIAVAERPGGLKAGEFVVTSGSLLLNQTFGELPQPK
jgi:cobalt-zinc-cadmium efflux system membrane fusion protein